MAIEYRVWSESSDLVLATEDAAKAIVALSEARRNCPCGEGNIEWPKNCGVLNPHGYHVQIIDGEDDVTGDPNYNLD